MRIVSGALRQPGGATIAQVSFSDAGDFGAVGASERRGLQVFAPRGVAYRPCEGDNLLLLPADGGQVCAGVLSAGAGLAPGELRLTGAGGGVVHLKQNGDVVINGVVITRAGKIIPPGEV